ncbi:hypothetical protein [Tahibacter soli]|uniref:Uncharacterized protein n=1 Tax=Tahibacter soli TaxID=2983605 RepID=A0A9X3YQK5_9GAMM|nr:hypothetical protein [Tahibacter soli]MDC8015685.1 hypothetical protein [Tahibacter soli]
MSKRTLITLFLAGATIVLFGVWRARAPETGSTAVTPDVDTSRTSPTAPVSRPPVTSAANHPNIDSPAFPPGLQPGPISTLTQTFEKSDNLARLVSELAPRVAAGDTEAARVVAQALDECAHLSVFPNFVEGIRKSAEAMPANRRDAALAHLTRFQERCGDLAGAEKITPERIRSAHEAASHGNDLVDQGRRLTASSASMSASEVKDSLRRIVQSRNGEAIASIADAMAESSDDRELFGPYSGSKVHAMAWRLVACDLGMPCGPDSAQTRQACMVFGNCIRGDYREVVRFFFLSPWEFELAAAEERKILQEIIDGNFDRLFP